MNRLKNVFKFVILLVLLGFSLSFFYLHGENSDKNVTFKGQYGPIPPEIQKKMMNSSWRCGCPVSLEELAYTKVSFWGFDGKVHEGELVVHRKLTPEVLQIFIELFESHFPIERMKLIDDYDHDDNKSMEADNTSAFNCRSRTGNPGVYSLHSYGIAIDINPLFNPFIDKKKGLLAPKSAAQYVDRSNKVRGMIVKGDACYNAFVKRGWTWGGDWVDQIDYQHFEKEIVK
jgi:hypothetical protein